MPTLHFILYVLDATASYQAFKDSVGSACSLHTSLIKAHPVAYHVYVHVIISGSGDIWFMKFYLRVRIAREIGEVAKYF